ncbi:MAG: hypothetical protein ACUVQY_10935 [Thermoproteota archaeon]
MVSQAFLERLKNYLNEKYKNDPGFEPFEIFCPDKMRNWMINTYGLSSFGVLEFPNGKVEVFSHAIEVWKDVIFDILTKRVYRYRLKKAKTEKEIEKMIFGEISKKEDEILENLANRRWEKYLDKKYVKKYGYFIIELFWEEEVARRISEKYGVEVRLEVSERSNFVSIFDSKEMTEEQIFNEIVKRAEVIHVAYKLVINYVEKRKFYEEFKANLARNMNK